MGLRKLICLLPAETSDHDGGVEEMEQPGTSYNSNNNEGMSSAYREYNKKVKAEKMNCSNGTAQLFACFRAGAINLIVSPACDLACQRQGASTVQPVNSLPRPAFLDGPEAHDSGDDPTSPVVSCIGQVRKEKPSKIPPRATTAEAPTLRSLKSNRGKPEDDSTEASRPCKWKKILGARGSVNPSHQTTYEESSTSSSEDYSLEFHIDLNRFASAAAQATPTFGNHKKFGRPDYRDEPAARDSRDLGGNSKHADVFKSQATSEIGVPLWQRRSGACKPRSLELKRRVSQSVS